MKQKHFSKSTYSTLRASLEKMPMQAVNNSVSRISMPCNGMDLDQLDWDKVKLPIQENVLDFSSANCGTHSPRSGD